MANDCNPARMHVYIISNVKVKVDDDDEMVVVTGSMDTKRETEKK